MIHDKNLYYEKCTNIYLIKLDFDTVDFALEYFFLQFFNINSIAIVIFRIIALI